MTVNGPLDLLVRMILYIPKNTMRVYWDLANTKMNNLNKLEQT